MDPEEAYRRFGEGAFVIILNVPKNFQIGIDGVSWSVGERFRGLKMIPSGLHFVNYRLFTDEGDAGPLCGFFHFYRTQDIVALTWNVETENLDFITDEECIASFRANLFDLDKFLGPFAFDRPEVVSFEKLCQHITDKLLDAVLPDSYHRLDIMSQVQYESKSVISDGEATIVFSKLPTLKELFPSDYLDRTRILDDIVRNRYGGDILGLIGEFELAFIIFFMGNNYEGFEQWRNLLSLFCQSAGKISTNPEVYLSFFDLLIVQMAELPADLFAGLLCEENSLFQWLHDLVDSCLEIEILRKRAIWFSLEMKRKFEWDLLSPNRIGDYAPTIVDTS